MLRAMKTTRIQYNDSLLRAFPLAIALAGLTAVSVAMEWKSVKKGRGKLRVPNLPHKVRGLQSQGRARPSTASDSI